jgi:hypothetical protein
VDELANGGATVGVRRKQVALLRTFDDFQQLVFERHASERFGFVLATEQGADRAIGEGYAALGVRHRDAVGQPLENLLVLGVAARAGRLFQDGGNVAVRCRALGALEIVDDAVPTERRGVAGAERL